jgi:hypothetical protein
MRRLWIFSIWTGLIVGGVISGSVKVDAEAVGTTRAQCVKMALKKANLEKSGIRKIMAMQPSDVRSKFGDPGIERVRGYIALREKVLFNCPADVLNMTAAALRRDKKLIPPLPQKRPKWVGRASSGGVRFQIPQPPG